MDDESLSILMETSFDQSNVTGYLSHQFGKSDGYETLIFYLVEAKETSLEEARKEVIRVLVEMFGLKLPQDISDLGNRVFIQWIPPEALQIADIQPVRKLVEFEVIPENSSKAKISGTNSTPTQSFNKNRTATRQRTSQPMRSNEREESPIPHAIISEGNAINSLFVVADLLSWVEKAQKDSPKVVGQGNPIAIAQQVIEELNQHDILRWNTLDRNLRAKRFIFSPQTNAVLRAGLEEMSSLSSSHSM